MEAVLDTPCPQNVTEVRSFVGLVNYYNYQIHAQSVNSGAPFEPAVREEPSTGMEEGMWSHFPQCERNDHLRAGVNTLWFWSTTEAHLWCIPCRDWCCIVMWWLMEWNHPLLLFYRMLCVHITHANCFLSLVCLSVSWDLTNGLAEPCVQSFKSGMKSEPDVKPLNIGNVLFSLQMCTAFNHWWAAVSVSFWQITVHSTGPVEIRSPLEGQQPPDRAKSLYRWSDN